MTQQYQPVRIRFGSFEFDLRTSELFENGQRIPLQDQPAKLLGLLATNSKRLVTRDEIQKMLWKDQFIEVDHGINAAIKKIRNALDEDPDRPKYIETLAKKGYRFIGDVAEIFDDKPPDVVASLPDSLPPANAAVTIGAAPVVPEGSALADAVLPLATSLVQSPGEKPFTLAVPVSIARFLFLLIQSGYLAIYSTALINVEALDDALSSMGMEPVDVTLRLVLFTGMCGIAVRIYLAAEVVWAHPAAGRQFRRLFPLLLVLDAIWAASPLLAGRTIGIGLALIGVAGLAYLPFAQRTLMVTIAPQAYVKTGSSFSL
jgi:DNA-binding winged helix-turn-helix (wHTH) protein